MRVRTAQDLTPFSARKSPFPPAAREFLFLLDGPRGDHVSFELRNGRVTTMVLNPGQWAQRARRKT